jgi:post-segregation antitoxin (ccd killing protein)
MENYRRWCEANRERRSEQDRARYRLGGHIGEMALARAVRLNASRAEMVRLGKLLARVSYRRWQPCAEPSGRSFVVFRSDPLDPTRLERLGPFPLPEDAGPEEVEAAALGAVLATDGEAARAEFRYRDAR